MFDDHLVQKQPMILVKKHKKIAVCLFLDNRGLEIMFDDHLVREQAILDYKKYDFTQSPSWIL